MLLTLTMLACSGPEPDSFVYPDKVPGAPVAGAAEGVVEIPVGAPMGGYSARCKLLGSASKQDNRKSHYALSFARSTGIHHRPKVKTLWLENGDEDLVLIKFDAIYAYDDLVRVVAERLGDQVGRDLTGKVVLTASHSHAMPANFSDQVHFYLGGDKFNPEIFERYVEAMVSVSLQAYEERQPAAIGVNIVEDWDPDDRVYRDRRGENDELQVWDDLPAGRWKDPYAYVIRVDSVDGDPIAMAVDFGMHGTLMGEDNPMWTGDSVTGLESVLEEQFDRPVVVMHLQGSGGDASPAGTGEGFARTESIGMFAADALMNAWNETPTSSEPLDLEVASRHIPSHRDDIRVTRDGTVDWYYLPYSEDTVPDDVIFEDDGSLSSPVDEFIFQYGAAFCGSDDPLIKVESQSEVYPYISCMDLELMSGLIAGTFDMDVNQFPLPMPESMEAGTAAFSLGPLPVRDVDGVVTDRELLVGAFPAEPASMFSEQWRRRAKAELGAEMPMVIGYAMDHEGYFLIPEDWLAGGYEPNINIWGPLQAEHVMEGVLTMARDVVLTPQREDADPVGWWSPTVYEDKPLPEGLLPDETPHAGELLDEVHEDFWVPEGFEVDLEVPETCPRVDCIVQIAFEGGDPAVDTPNVVLQRLEDGEWVDVTTRAGRKVDEAGHDILLGHTPDPLYPADAEQRHYWWAAWQAVPHHHDRTGLELGIYRLAVTGRSWDGGETHYPWSSSEYTLESDSFEVVPAKIRLFAHDSGLQAWIDAPDNSWRMIDLEGTSNGVNPIVGPVTVEWDNGTTEILDPSTSGSTSWLGDSIPEDATSVTVTDAYGNSGTLPL
jgi:neutral ceramidase